MSADKALEARARDTEQSKCYSQVWKAVVKKLHVYFSMPLLVDSLLAVCDDWLRDLQTDLEESDAPLFGEQGGSGAATLSREIASIRGAIDGIRKRFQSIALIIKQSTEKAA